MLPPRAQSPRRSGEFQPPRQQARAIWRHRAREVGFAAAAAAPVRATSRDESAESSESSLVKNLMSCTQAAMQLLGWIHA